MNLYKFEYEAWDEYYCFELCHNEKFSEEQLIEMQNKILEQILENQKLTKKKINEFNEGYNELLYCEAGIIRKIKDSLIKQYGFVEMKYDNILPTDIGNWYKKYITLEEPKIIKKEKDRSK